MAIDLGLMLLRHSVGGGRNGPRCSVCRRTPLPGEMLHVLETERTVCALCLPEVPLDRRINVRSERVRAGECHVAVAPRVASAARA